MATDNIHLRWRYSRGKQVYAATDMLGHAKCGGQGIDCTSRVGQDGELVDLECLTDSIHIIYEC